MKVFIFQKPKIEIRHIYLFTEKLLSQLSLIYDHDIKIRIRQICLFTIALKTGFHFSK